MNIFMTPELESVRDMVARFMQTEVVPVMDDFEKRQVLPRELIQKAGENGLYGAVYPESVGGSNLGYTAAAVIIEEMSRHDVRFGSCNNQQGGTCPLAIYMAGTPEQVHRYVPNLLAGKTIGMMSLSETGSGSDSAGAMKTFARLPHQRAKNVGFHRERNGRGRSARQDGPRGRCQGHHCLHCRTEEIPRIHCDSNRHDGPVQVIQDERRVSR